MGTGNLGILIKNYMDAYIATLPLPPQTNYDQLNGLKAFGNAIEDYFNKLAKFSFTVQNGVAGGNTVAGAWAQRPVNTINYDLIGCTLVANQITLPAGTYDYWLWGHFYQAGGATLCRNKIRNVTAGADLDDPGINAYTTPSYGGALVVPSVGRFTLAADSLIEIQYRTTGSSAGGLGVPTSFGTNEVYLIFILRKIG
jgi:hypothetical protein